MEAVKVIVVDVPHEETTAGQVRDKPPFTRNNNRVSGTPTLFGTRLPATTLLDYLIEGHTLDEFIDDFDVVTKAEAQAALMKIREAIDEGWLSVREDD